MKRRTNETTNNKEIAQQKEKAISSPLIKMNRLFTSSSRCSRISRKKALNILLSLLLLLCVFFVVEVEQTFMMTGQQQQKTNLSLICQEEQSHVGYVKDVNFPGLQPFHIEVYQANDIVSNQIKKDGTWDVSKTNLFKKIVSDYSKEKNIPIEALTFVDIGSNIGWFTFTMAAMGLEVMAFEPMTSNIAMLKRSLCIETNIESGISNRINLFPYALGPKEQSCFVVSGSNNEGDGHTFCVESESDLKLEPREVIREKIMTKRLDDIASTKGKIIPLVKIDVEGYESHVVEGGTDFLLQSKIPFIIAEFVPKWMRRKDGDPEKMMQRFYDAGYQVFKNDSNHLTRDQAMNMEQYNSSNDVIFHLVEDSKV